MITFVISLINDEWIKTLITLIALDTILGFLRSIKEKQTNSCIGIDGIIRKVAMLFCIFFLSSYKFRKGAYNSSVYGTYGFRRLS